MKKYSLLILLLPLCFSMISSDNENQDDLFIIGSWSGVMHKKPLTIVIEKIENNIAYGYNILGTAKRPIKGTIISKNDDTNGECLGDQSLYKATLKEPGTDAWDGVFTITFFKCAKEDPESEVIEREFGDGTWKANNGKSSGSFTLLRK